MHDYDGQSIATIGLPVAVTEDLYSTLYFNQALLGGGQHHAPRQKKVRQGLKMSSAQATARPKSLCLGLRSPHHLILNGDCSGCRPCEGVGSGANLRGKRAKRPIL